mmetsp:Transcript_10848/g.50021  ORF Transcript_10848/g.50021 Transcript_10848/m.50021 type:complete len:200 (-) Transcript_10848:1413-2012(-)
MDSSSRRSESVGTAPPRVMNAASVSPGASFPSTRVLCVLARTAAAASSVSAVLDPSPPGEAAALIAATSATAVPADVHAASTAAADTLSAPRNTFARSDHRSSCVARATSPSKPSARGYSSRTDTAAGAKVSPPRVTPSTSSSSSPFIATFTSWNGEDGGGRRRLRSRGCASAIDAGGSHASSPPPPSLRDPRRCPPRL